MIRLSIAVYVALVLALGWALFRAESYKGQADRAQEAAERNAEALMHERAARQREQAGAAKLAEIAAQYEQDKSNAQAEADRIIADLRSGNQRLHQRWQACSATADLSAATAPAGQLDAGADDRAASAARIVAAADNCDAQVRGLQAVIRADRNAGL